MMEENFYHSDFEDFIREKADQYKMYPSDKVWKGVERSLRTRRRWYWTGFVVLLTGVSYFAINDLLTPSQLKIAALNQPATTADNTVPQELNPFRSGPRGRTEESSTEDPVLSGISVEEDSGNITASFEIPLRLLDLPLISGMDNEKASLVISGLKPLGRHEEYQFELSWPVRDFPSPGPARVLNALYSGNEPAGDARFHDENTLNPGNETETVENGHRRINWLQEGLAERLPLKTTKRIKWQLAFSPTVNYRKLTGGRAKITPNNPNIPVAIRIDGDVNDLVDHKPAIGFELGTHGMLPLSRNLTFKGGIQFNYSKYDIRAFRTPVERATIALNSSLGQNSSSLVSYTDLSNFNGTSVQDLKNQYFQLSMPIGFELKVLGNEKLQFNVASTIQPTYLLNRNTYLITTDFKNYTKEPSLVRRWNVNAGAEAFVSYNSGGVKWQIGPQFRYQLLSSYDNAYPIKEYLMEYGIKVGVTKTIR